MLVAYQTDQWDHTAAITSVLINANRKKGSPPVKPADLNPYRGKPSGKHRLSRENVRILKTLAGRVE